jgi:hypothetical protein
MVGHGCKVFCIGFAKTGTTSLKEVLEQLGYRTQDVVESEKLIEDWARRDFRSLIELCKRSDAFQDVPFNLPFSFQALDAAFPGSKFVLTFRDDSEAWYRSWSTFIAALVGTGFPPDEASLKAFPVPYPGWLWRLLEVTVGTQENPFDQERCTQYYEAHNAAVLEYFRFRPESFLALRLGDPAAIEHLCEFLEVGQRLDRMPHITSKMIVSAVRKGWKLDP